MEQLKDPVLQLLLEKYNWKRIKAPRVWRPKDSGDEIIGFYGGRTIRTGNHGQYEIVLLHVPTKGAYMISGVQLIRLLDAAMLEIGHPIRIIWRGYQDLGNEKKMKSFEVFAAEGDPLTHEEIDALQEALT